MVGVDGFKGLFQPKWFYEKGRQSSSLFHALWFLDIHFTDLFKVCVGKEGLEADSCIVSLNSTVLPKKPPHVSERFSLIQEEFQIMIMIFFFFLHKIIFPW